MSCQDSYYPAKVDPGSRLRVLPPPLKSSGLWSSPEEDRMLRGYSERWTTRVFGCAEKDVTDDNKTEDHFDLDRLAGEFDITVPQAHKDSRWEVSKDKDATGYSSFADLVHKMSDRADLLGSAQKTSEHCNEDGTPFILFYGKPTATDTAWELPTLATFRTRYGEDADTRKTVGDYEWLWSEIKRCRDEGTQANSKLFQVQETRRREDSEGDMARYRLQREDTEKAAAAAAQAELEADKVKAEERATAQAKLRMRRQRRTNKTTRENTDGGRSAAE